MVVRGARGGRRGVALRRAVRGVAAALILASHAASQDVDAAVPDLGERLARFRAESAGAFEAEALVELYRVTVDTWALDPSLWPAAEDFDDVVDELHRAAEARGIDPGPLLALDCVELGAFLDGDRLVEGCAFAERMCGVYPEDRPDYVLLLIDLAQGMRLRQEFDRHFELLERAEGIVRRHEDERGPWLFAALNVQLERVTNLTAGGLQELAVPVLADVEAWFERTSAALSDVQRAYFRQGLFLEQLNLANVLDDYDRVETLLEGAERQPWFAEVEPYYARRYRLRRAASLVDRELLDPNAPPRALEALEAYLADPEADERRIALPLLVDCLMRAGRLDEARARLEQARSLPAGRAFSDFPSRRELELVVLEAMLDLAQHRDRPDVLRAALERTRGVLDGWLARWEAASPHDGGRSLLHTHDRMRMVGCVTDLQLAVDPDPRPALELVARVQAAGSLARVLRAPVPDLDEVRARLVPPDGGLVTYLPGFGGTVVFVLDAEGLEAVSVPPVHVWERARRELSARLARALALGEPASALDDAVAPLEEVLLPTALRERLRGWRSLVVAGVDGLGYVPFELLRVDGARLGRTHAVSYVPSLPVGCALARVRPSGDAPWRVLAAQDAASAAADGKVALPFGTSERERLLDGTSFAPLEVLDGPRATLARALDTPATALGLHLIAHTVDSGRIDRPRALALADGELTPERMEQGHCPPFVGLMACGAGQGPLRRGDDGRHHWGGALLLAGARVVVLSYLDMPYQGSLALFGDAYRALSVEGASPAEALRAARTQRDEQELAPYLVHALGLAQAPLVEAGTPPPGRRVRWGWIPAVVLVAGAAALLGRAGRRG